MIPRPLNVIAAQYRDCQRCIHRHDEPATRCLPCDYSDYSFHPDFDLDPTAEGGP